MSKKSNLREPKTILSLKKTNDNDDLNNGYKCQNCGSMFTRKYSLKRHQKESCKSILESPSNDHRLITEIEDSYHKYPYECEHCQSLFTGDEFLEAHLKSHCKLKQCDFDKLNSQINISNESNGLKENYSIVHMAKKIRELEDKLTKNDKIKTKDINNNNNILQVLCVSEGQNFLDILTEHWGDYSRALEFVKDCALSSINGDCKLIEKIYFEGLEPPIKYLDRGRNKLEYVDENNNKRVDLKGHRVARILASNLQNSYLKGINYLINKNLNENRCPNKFLAEYDIQCWNNHIYELCDVKYQKKVIANLDIPGITNKLK